MPLLIVLGETSSDNGETFREPKTEENEINHGGVKPNSLLLLSNRESGVVKYNW
jgi:hypothetical protein